MSNRDKNDRELQVAAVWLSQKARNQESVAEELKRMYPSRGAFDNTRVSRLCRSAIDEGLAEPPSVAQLRLTTAAVKELLARVRKVYEDSDLSRPITDALGIFCAKHDVKCPIIIVVPGRVDKTNDSSGIEFSHNAAAVAVDHICRWAEKSVKPRDKKDETLYLGVTWGKQLAMVSGDIDIGRLPKDRIAIMPLVGLPIGSHRSDVLSSSEIASSLAKNLRLHRHEYDLQLVPAYLPENVFDDSDLPTMYRFLNQISGWIKIFGANYMPPSSTAPIAASMADVFKCNFILSSVSDISEPFGLSARKHDSLAPFGAGGAARVRPVADCGGIPLWHVRNSTTKELEESFAHRWTGVRRDQWKDCVERGFGEFKDLEAMAGAIIFAPTQDKAESVLLVIRDELANIVVLGLPCAQKLREILRDGNSRRQASKI